VELLLLSGGLESTALAAWRRPDLALTIDYGQIPAIAESDSAGKICQELGLKHHQVRVDCRHLGSGLLASSEPSPHAPSPEWWPYRNQLLVTLAAAWGLSREITSITVGSVLGDGERHIDGRAAFYERIDALLAMQEGGMRVTAPAAGMTSDDLIIASGVPDAILGWTHSCHRSNLSCGDCPGCAKRREVFERLGRMRCET
jgi:7-cyano-7-deazaguanine synthase